MKKTLFYAFIVIFILTAAVTLLGITNVISIKDKYLGPLCAALLIELVGSVIGIYRKVDFFDDNNKSLDDNPFKSLNENGKSKSSNKIDNETKASRNKEIPELDEYFTKLEKLSDRFREKDNLKKEYNGKIVEHSGLVTSVNKYDSNSLIAVNLKTESIFTIIIKLPMKLETDAFSLRKGDKIKVCGELNFFSEYLIYIDCDSFERVDN